jgi:hypothetical protein
MAIEFSRVALITTPWIPADLFASEILFDSLFKLHSFTDTVQVHIRNWKSFGKPQAPYLSAWAAFKVKDELNRNKQLDPSH